MYLLYTLTSVLVLLSPLFFLFSFPIFAAAVWFGARSPCQTVARCTARVGLLVAGAIGLVSDATALAFMASAHPPRGPFLDSMDWGPLAGMPTLLAIFISMLTMALAAALIWWLCSARTVARTSGSPGA